MYSALAPALVKKVVKRRVAENERKIAKRGRKVI
jgi:hypothetical protein